MGDVETRKKEKRQNWKKKEGKYRKLVN